MPTKGATRPGPAGPASITPELARALGVRRTIIMRRVVKVTGLPTATLLDLAMELLDKASRGLAHAVIDRQPIGLGAARWHKVSPEVRRETLRQVALARWDKHRRAPDVAAESVDSGGEVAGGAKTPIG